MSVDKLRGSRHINRISPSDIGLLMSAQSYRPEITKAINKIKSLKWCLLQELVINTISPGPHPKYGGSYPCLKTKNVDGLLAILDPADYADETVFKDLNKVTVKKGDLLINLTGAGSIGRVSVYYGDDRPITNQHIARMSVKPNIDEAYLACFLRSWWGERALEQGVAGSTGQINMVNEHVRSIPVYLPDNLAQKYIGDKVRQAEQLRAWAKRLEGSIESLLISSEAFVAACETPNKLMSRPQLNDLSNRLDPKYYGTKAIAVHRFARKAGPLLGSLVNSVANGFEERTFVENGLAYITVSEVSSGRLNSKAAPKISKSINVPAKAIVHESCVLVVRTGSIGTAVKVHSLDRGCAISSHLIRLEFKEEATAAAVAVFLNSKAGKVLLHKISYGAVQPQIGQEELLALSIPKYVLDLKEEYLHLLNNYELSIRASSSLTMTAKTLVESLIEGQLTEQQLIKAQQALDDGDHSLDQAILSKLSADGFAIEGATPLFSDLDELYRLLESAAQAEA
ncbi:MAG: restriction endonuclease subunit S [Pseudomonadota bacterium]|nr:restriction endonuclease subunit S [Pseudomonadota bacterium]